MYFYTKNKIEEYEITNERKMSKPNFLYMIYMINH